jgi:hypothetical protein
VDADQTRFYDEILEAWEARIDGVEGIVIKWTELEGRKNVFNESSLISYQPLCRYDTQIRFFRFQMLVS